MMPLDPSLLMRRQERLILLFLFLQVDKWSCVICKLQIYLYFPFIFTNTLFLAVQNSSIGDLVTDSLTKGTYTFDIQRATLRPVTFETFDQSDEET